MCPFTPWFTASLPSDSVMCSVASQTGMSAPRGFSYRRSMELLVSERNSRRGATGPREAQVAGTAVEISGNSATSVNELRVQLRVD